MIRPNTIKVLTLGAAITGLSFLGAATATAQPDVRAASAVTISCGGADSTRCQTNGSSQIHTAPDRKIAKPAHDYGPFFKQNRGRFGAGAGRGR